MEENISLIEQAREAAKELRAANAEKAELLNREERLRSEQMLSGTSEAGIPPVPKKEETPQEYKDRIIKGNI